MKPAALDVLMPIYNAGAYLDEAIESLRSQTFTDFRVVAIDDGSTDGSAERYERLTAGDSRFTLTRQANAGVARTLNNGLRMCQAEIIARHDADDRSAPTRFAKQVEHLHRHPATLAVGCDYQKLIGDRPGYVREMPMSAELIRLLMISRNCLAHGGMMIRRIAFNRAGFYSEAPETKHVEDFDLWERILSVGPIENVPEILYFHRAHEGAVSTQGANAQSENAERLCRRLISRIGRDPALLVSTVLRASLQLLSQPLSPLRGDFLRQHLLIGAEKASAQQEKLLAFGLRRCAGFVRVTRRD